MNLPKISVVTPSYNSERFIGATIESVVGQNYPDLDYVIVDGGSNDGTVDIIRSYESELSYWVSEPDKGMYDALNKGFQKTSGEIMLWINSDDILHSSCLRTLGELYSQCPDVNWFHGCTSMCSSGLEVVSAGSPPKWSRFDYYLGNFRWIQQEAVSWRRSLWEKSGGFVDSEMKYAGDLELWCRFFRTSLLHVGSLPTGSMRTHSGGQLSGEHFPEYLDEAHRSIEREVKQLSPSDRRILRMAKWVLLFVQIASYFRILNTSSFYRIFRSRFLKESPQVSFDFRTNQFKK